VREIEFRAWDESTKEMIYQDFPRGVLSAGELLKRFSVIMQFTGLHDKNGKKIFEGDILKCVAGKCPYCGTPDSEPIGHKPYPVFWDTNEARFKAENADNYLLPDCWGDSTEIIGNVFEHPELLTP